MPAAIQPQKRVLGDSTNINAKHIPSPKGSKRRKLDAEDSTANRLAVRKESNGVNGSSQPKSQFEEDLEKLTQDINGLKEKNSEKDQGWDRPPLTDFDENRDSLIFQQIEAEEGTLHGGRTTVKLFGVTEVSGSWSEKAIHSHD